MTQNRLFAASFKAQLANFVDHSQIYSDFEKNSGRAKKILAAGAFRGFLLLPRRVFILLLV